MSKQSDQLFKWVGILAIGYFAFEHLGSAFLSKLGFGRPALSVQSWQATHVAVSFRLPITNNTPVAIPVQSIQGNIKYGNNVLTNFFVSNHFVIEGNGTTQINFEGIIDYAQLTGSIANVIESREWLQALVFEGHVVSNNLIFPFRETVQVGV